MIFRKKPVEVEAVQWTGDNVKEVMDFMSWRNAAHDGSVGLTIRTLEGTHHASPGDWIIKGVKGEFYPCKPDIFDMTYEPSAPRTGETGTGIMSEWISVEDRVPENEREVLTWIGHRACVDFYSYLDPDVSGFGFDGVTHWMPLPDPPAAQPTPEREP